jgi:hypothetical protein
MSRGANLTAIACDERCVDRLVDRADNDVDRTGDEKNIEHPRPPLDGALQTIRSSPDLRLSRGAYYPSRRPWPDGQHSRSPR